MQASPAGQAEQKVRLCALTPDSRLRCAHGGLAQRGAFPQTADAAEEWQSG